MTRTRKLLLGGRGVALLVVLSFVNIGLAEEPPADLEQLRQSARAGDEQALFGLADRYERGESVAQDLSMTAALRARAKII